MVINRSFLKNNSPKCLTPHLSLLMFAALMLLTACGYKPSSWAIENIFSDSVYVEVHVDRAEPENAPFLKDEMNRMVYTRFKGKIVPKEQAKSQIIISYNGTTFTPLAYKDGYISRYRANIRVAFDMITSQGRLKKTITAVQEGDVQVSSMLSSKLRIEAIRKGMEKAMNEFLAYVSAKGIRVGSSE